jgi:hypothetical protein
MSNDAETDAALRPWATATSYTYLAIRLTLDAFFFLALARPPGYNAIQAAAEIACGVNLLLAPFCLIASFIMFRMSIRGHPVCAALAAFDSIVAAAVVAVVALGFV